MIYNLPEIELTQIQKASKNGLYKVERDRLKSRFFIYLNYPKINYHGLNLNEAQRFVYGDFIARYQRLIGRNVLFSIGYNNVDSSIFKHSAKLDKPIYNFCASQFTVYQKQLRLLDVGFDEEKEILLSSDDYTKYVQQVFLFLYDKNLINHKFSLVVHSDDRIYQKGEYYIENGEYYSLDNNKLKTSYRNNYVLKLNTIKKDLFKEIERLEVRKDVKDLLLKRFCFSSELKISCKTTADVLLDISMENPEYLCGVSYIALNPNYMDIEPFITSDECGNLEEIMHNVEMGFIYSGVDLLNPIINNMIPIFLSTKFDEAIHIGIPSISDEEEYIVGELGLEYNPIFDYINEERVLVNSGRFNGYTISEAHEEIIKHLISEGAAEELFGLRLDELIISSNIKFGIPIPLHTDNTAAKIPVIHNLRHDVNFEYQESTDKTLVKEFLNDEFVKHLLPNAIRLKTSTGIIDFESMEALDEIGMFRQADVALLKTYDYVDDLLWNIVFNRIFARYYTAGFDCEFKNMIFVKPIMDQNGMLMNRDNNNLVSINELLDQYGSTIIRAYYAMTMNQEVCFNLEDINEIIEIVERIVKTYYYPIDDACVDLDIAYQRLIDNANYAASKNDFNNYFDCILEFIKKVHEIKHISRTQAKGLLIVLSVIMPSLAEQIKEDVLNIREPLCYFSWPE